MPNFFKNQFSSIQFLSRVPSDALPLSSNSLSSNLIRWVDKLIIWIRSIEVIQNMQECQYNALLSCSHCITQGSNSQEPRARPNFTDLPAEVQTSWLQTTIKQSPTQKISWSRIRSRPHVYSSTFCCTVAQFIIFQKCCGIYCEGPSKDAEQEGKV